MTKTKRNAALWLALLAIIIGGGLLVGCADSRVVSVPEGPGMLYFYATW